ncbi:MULTISPECIES: hypothetical protein [Clostridium]|uniref:Hydrogenase nickel incorporation protein n=2 Tax=Clostridium TaxID=1485 RepID=D8GNP8_CLOLD|nr:MULTISPECIES: hypothetical protein [Clostridium]ADK15911.1 conserved hypothetical protein [Clostridium ljungdahlii DSM 13528]AGY75085.1 hypothetical protein CAETHG_0858 [Clostridium autoethanogenum DSM 10061]ALU35257.1 Hypothetical protein CLAU_0828 [Clostridium autoethanogenum DSM 10061]OAA87211.1 hypothetical protein WX45_03841 [Clostridium ljungdahlii DSM 13528]OVY49664.1 hypothetical protein WX72_03589 [Clostridium autoethanogenum]
MHDMILLSKISRTLSECCSSNKILKIGKVVIAVNSYSHVNENNLYDYLRNYNEDITDESTEVKIEIENLPNQMAIIKNIEGYQYEDEK